MFIRYFVTADESVDGLFALNYLPSLLRIAPVRLVDPRKLVIGSLEGRWFRHSGLLATPMDGDFINVVCTHPDRWTWLQRVSAPKENKAAAEIEKLAGWCELYTSGHRNVLISRLPPAMFTEEQQATAAKYEAVIVEMHDDIIDWPRFVSQKTPVHLPPPITDHAAMRRTIRGE